ncbi:MAG: hypothetical protein L0Y60_04665 [Beijerinckiaceae bacterium]|nr:hypothetical protein [Beijerinckiaceae bacterium]
MLDFTFALYLGIRHAHRTLPPWTQLTTGRPASFAEAEEADRVAQDLARLLRCERAALAPSTLHIYLDLFQVLARDHTAICVDAGTYPIARWGVERVAAKGVRTATFRMHDPAALELLLRRDRGAGYIPIVVSDGVYPGTGRAAPLADYLTLVREQSGYLVVDDTQALGILGVDPGQDAPYGRGGGGTPAWHGIGGPELIIGSSLAKGLGVPLAVLAGNAGILSKFEDRSATRMHCSPPSLAAVSATQQALAINGTRGDYLRGRLAILVRHFKNGLRQIGLLACGGMFPVQTLRAISGIDPEQLYRRLLTFGIRAVLHRAQNAHDAALGFLITTLHTRSDIDRCVAALQKSCALLRRKCEQRVLTN